MKDRLEAFLENSDEQDYISSELEEIYKEMGLNIAVSIPNNLTIMEEEAKKPAWKKPEATRKYSNEVS